MPRDIMSAETMKVTVAITAIILGLVNCFGYGASTGIAWKMKPELYHMTGAALKASQDQFHSCGVGSAIVPLLMPTFCAQRRITTKVMKNILMTVKNEEYFNMDTEGRVPRGMMRKMETNNVKAVRLPIILVLPNHSCMIGVTKSPINT